ncbi:hypothetical protein BHE74_00022553 [Ensete ventricosum]|nr:hypothetical protein BHE74_00022553 [Ensete ventricosum]RZS24655.1 hypothetical protein BHM03_00057742 [Ensete ventricosum]
MTKILNQQAHKKRTKVCFHMYRVSNSDKQQNLSMKKKNTTDMNQEPAYKMIFLIA